MPSVLDTGYVLSYNTDQFKRTPYPAPPGSIIEWKRNGRRGSLKARILAYDTTRPTLVKVAQLSHDLTRVVSDRKVWISKYSVLKVLEW